MAVGYSGEKILQRQRTCLKCRSFITHAEEGAGGQVACPLCGHRSDGPPVRVHAISARELALMVQHQLQMKKEKEKEKEKDKL